MIYHLEFGSCRALYGCVGMTAVEAYSFISKMRNVSTTLVLENSSTVALCDIAVVDTVQTLLTCKSFINSDMIVVVCDSGPAIASLTNVIPYDYEGDVFSNFTLKAPPKSLPLRDFRPTRIEIIHTDPVKQAMQSIVTASMLSDYNSVIAKMNGPARTMLRQKICDLMINRETVEGISRFLHGLDLEADNFVAKLGSKYFIALRNAVYYYSQGHSLEYVQSKFGVKDSYEITYFAKMLKDHVK